MKLKKKLAKRLPAVLAERAKVLVGKNGLTKEVIQEVDKQLEQHELIKIKFLQNFLTDDFNQDIQQLAKQTKASLVDTRGKTIVLYRPSYHK
jgi:RNA-binding protein